MMKMMSNTLNPPTRVTVNTIRNTGMICGRMTYQSRAAAFAPSIRLASTSSTSTLRSAEMKITTANPVPPQMAVTSTAYRAQDGSPSQPRCRLSSPTAPRKVLSRPCTGS
jgi:hypothetical protein